MYCRNNSGSGRTFTKTIVLLTDPNCRKVPLGQDKLKLYLSKNIIDAVEIPLGSDERELVAHFSSLFTQKLGDAK